MPAKIEVRALSKKEWKAKVLKIETWIDNYQRVHGTADNENATDQTLSHQTNKKTNKKRKLDIVKPLGTGIGSILESGQVEDDPEEQIPRSSHRIPTCSENVNSLVVETYEDIISLTIANARKKKLVEKVAFKLGIYGKVTDKKYEPLLKKYYKDYDLGRILRKVLLDAELVTLITPHMTKWCAETQTAVYEPLLKAAE